MPFLRTMFTTADNQTGDLGRVLWAAAFVAFVCFSVWSLYRGQAWDPVSWVTGVGGLLTTGGGALLLKHKTEPPPGPPPGSPPGSPQ